MIPRNLIQFWHDLNSVPEVITKAMAVTENNNSNYTNIKADDVFMYKFILDHYNEMILALYTNNRIAASRSDIARLMLLYEFGGFYIDASMELQGNLDSINKQDDELVLVKRDDAAPYKKCPDNAHYINGIIGVTKKSKFIKSCIEQLLTNLVLGQFNKAVNLATGPRVINSTFEAHSNLNFTEHKFTSLLGSLFVYRRTPGINNLWVCDQSNGIITPYAYSNRLQHSRLWFFGRLAVYFSFAFLFLPKDILTKASSLDAA